MKCAYTCIYIYIHVSIDEQFEPIFRHIYWYLEFLKLNIEIET
jgi:hypothetical protein